MINSYIILDRDGTLIKNVPYLSDPNEIFILPGTIEGLQLLKSMNYRFGIVTNQSAIGRGLATRQEVELVNSRMYELFHNFEINFDFLLLCPHTPDENCFCRKPNVGLGFYAINEFKVDADSSFMIGDKDSDIQFGKSLGLKTVRILSSYPTNITPNYLATNLLEAAEKIYFRNDFQR
jgi:D-glycero-D-manno-heptose 1,7-bisphosphate phosphatase